MIGASFQKSRTHQLLGQDNIFQLSFSVAVIPSAIASGCNCWMPQKLVGPKAGGNGKTTKATKPSNSEGSSVLESSCPMVLFPATNA